MRKISLFLVLTLLIGCLQTSLVYAGTNDAVITKDVSENSNTNVIASSQYADGYGMYAGKYVEFTVVPEKTGAYDVSLTYGAFEGAVIEVYLDGVMKLTRDVNTGGWSSPVTESFGELELVGGTTYTLKVMVGANATETIQFKTLTLTKQDAEPPAGDSGVITKDVSENSNTNVIATSQYEEGYGMYAGKYVEFTVVPEETGTYDVSLTYGAFEGAVIEVYLDGVIKSTQDVNTGGWSSHVTESFGELELEGGTTYTLKVMVGADATETIQFKTLTLTKQDAEPPAGDSGVITKDVSENSNTNVVANSQYPDGYGMYAGKYVEFTVVPEETGTYDVFLTYGAFEGAVIEVYLNGVIKSTQDVNTGGWSSHVTESFGELELEGGTTYTIKVMVGADATETIQLKTLTLTKQDADPPAGDSGVITKDVSENSGTNVIASSQYADGYGMYAGKYVEFTVIPEETGTYDVSLTYGAFEGAVIEVYLNGVMKLTRDVNTGGWGGGKALVTESFGELELEGGTTYTIKVMVGADATETIQFKKITLTKSGDADGTLTRFVGEATGTNIANGSKYGDGSGAVGWAFSHNKYIEFTIPVPESAKYSVSFLIASVNDKPYYAVDGAKAGEAVVATGDFNSFSEIVFGETDLDAGDRVIKIQLPSDSTTGACHLKQITLQKVGDYTPPKSFAIEAEDYNPGGKNVGYFDATDGLDREWNIDRGDDVEVAESGGGLVVIMSPTEWLKYDVTINASGKYNLLFKYATTVECNMTVFSDEEKLLDGTLPVTEGWSKYKDVKLGAVYLEEGEHTLKLLLNSGEVNFDGFTCDYAGDAFVLEKVNSGANEVTQNGTIPNSADSFVLDFSDDVNADTVTAENISLTDAEDAVSYDLIVTNDKVMMILKESLQKNTDYSLEIKNIADVDEFFEMDTTEILFATGGEGIPGDTIADMEKSVSERVVTVTGTVLSSQGMAIAGRNVSLTITGVNGTVVANALSQTDGSFTLNYEIPADSADIVFNFEVTTEYGIETKGFSVPYITETTETVILADFSATTELEGDNGLLSVVDRYDSLLGWTPETDLAGIVNSNNVYNALVGIDATSADELSQFYYTRIAVERLTQSTTKDDIAGILSNELNCERLGIDYEVVSVIETGKDAFANEVLALPYVNDEAYTEALADLVHEWALAEFEKADQELSIANMSLYYGQSADINLLITPAVTDVKKIVLTVTLSDETLWDEAFYTESSSVTGALSGTGATRTLVLSPKNQDAIENLGTIKLLPEATGNYTLSAAGQVEYTVELPFVLQSEIHNKEVAIAITTNSNNSGDRLESGGESTGGGGGGSAGGGGGNTDENSSSDNATVPQLPETPEKVEQRYAFVDTEDVNWAENALEYLLGHNIISKPQDRKFRPNDNITREEFVKMIVMALGIYDSTAASAFKDVSKDSWCYPYIASAYKAGVVFGNEENKFGVGNDITREDMATIIVRTLQKTGFDSGGDINEVFEDDQQISAYAREAVYFAKQLEIINGVGGNMFAPKQQATRAMAAKMIYEMMKVVGK